MSLTRHGLRLAQALVVAAVAALAGATASAADFVANPADLAEAVSALKAAIGPHPRALSVSIEPAEVAIEAQNPRNERHVDRWRYVARHIGPLTFKSQRGPEAVSLNLIDPDLEANLFDLDAVDFSAAGRLVGESLKRAGLEDAAAVASIEIKRQVAIIPQPRAGDVRWTLHVASQREQASVFADAAGRILGADLSGTRRAETLDIFAAPALVGEAVAAFGDRLGPGALLTKVEIEAKRVAFTTARPDKTMKTMMHMPATELYVWGLGGLTRQLGSITFPSDQPPHTFAPGDVDWTILGALEAEALKRAEAPGARVAEASVEKSAERPGGPAIVWRVDVRDSEGETTHVYADVRGAILDVEAPDGRQPKPNWLAPKTLAASIAKVRESFGAGARVASMVFEDDSARVSVETPDTGGAATYDFNGRSFKRADISFSIETTGPRFSLADASALNEALFARLEADALTRLAGKRKAYLQSVSIGPQMFARGAGAKAMEIRIRDREVNSAQAQYGWIIYSFDGRVLDSSPM